MELIQRSRSMGRRSELWKLITTKLYESPIGFRMGHNHPKYYAVFTVMPEQRVGIVSNKALAKWKCGE